VLGAFLGDPGALKVVADAVILALRRPGEAMLSTRRRCRDQFLATGALFSADSARERFPGKPAGDLSALDAALCSALGRDGTDRGAGTRDDGPRPGGG
jgi:hypothetical protein